MAKKKSGKFLTQKILAKPKARLKLDRKDILNELKKSNKYKMVREETEKEAVEDYNKSAYFNKEFREEKKREGKWLS